MDGYTRWTRHGEEEVMDEDTLKESTTLPSATADGKGKDGGRQRPLPSAADSKRLRQSRHRQRASLPSVF